MVCDLFFLDSVVYRKAIFKLYGIRDLSVKLHRVQPKKKLLAAKKVGSVRTEVPWIPKNSTVAVVAKQGL